MHKGIPHYLILCLTILSVFSVSCEQLSIQERADDLQFTFKSSRTLLYGLNDKVRIEVENNSNNILSEISFKTSPPNFAKIDTVGYLIPLQNGSFKAIIEFEGVELSKDFEVFPVQGLGLKNPDAAMVNFLKKYDIAGGVLGITNLKELTYIKAFGYANLATAEAMRPDDRLRIASISKPITATAIMKLAQEEKVQLDDYAFEIMGDTADIVDKRLLQIRVRHLLNHTAGWDRELAGDPMFQQSRIMQDIGLDKPATASQILQWLKKQPLQTQPGTSYAYSNVGYLILGRIIEKITQRPYEDVIDSLLFRPAQMHSAAIGYSQQIKRLENEVYYYNRGLLGASIFSIGDQALATYEGMGGTIESMDSHGGWVMSMPDLARFAIRSDGADATEDFLMPATFNLMILPTNSGYGYGWAVSQNTHSHTGGLPGTASFIHIDRQRNVSVVCALNSSPLVGTTEYRDFYQDFTQLLILTANEYITPSNDNYFSIY